MVRTNILRAKLRSGEPTFATHIVATWPWVVEAIGQTGMFDYVEFSGEYSSYTLHDLDNLCRAADLVGLDMMVKVDYDTHQFVSQHAIGSGFSSVLFADPHNVEEARRCVRSIRPDTLTDGGTMGSRSRRFNPGFGGSPDYVQALRDVVCMLMIEKKGAVDELDGILAIPGVDMIQWGPGDYSMNIDKAGQGKSAQVKAVEKHVIETAIKRGIRPRAEIATPDEAKYYLELGVKDFALGTDIYILFNWLRDNGKALRDLTAAAR